MDKNNNDDENNSDFSILWMAGIYRTKVSIIFQITLARICLNTPMHHFSARLNMLLIM
jgi:hypothetical protein